MDTPNYRPFFVGFGHKSRQGKDTLAAMVHSLIPGASKTYAFADALKAHARVLGLMDRKDGHVLQTLGTALYRHKNPNFWIKILNMRIEEEWPPIALITDMRFRNEQAYVEQHGISVNVVRLNEDGSRYLADDRNPMHESETALDDSIFSYTVTAKNLLHLAGAAHHIVRLIQQRISIPPSLLKE